MNRRVLVLDGNQRSALAVTRSLGRRGIEMFCGEETSKSLAGSSRYAAKDLWYPSPSVSPSDFLDEIASTIKEHRIDVVLPMTDTTTGLLLRNRDAAGGAILPFPDFDVYDSLVNKRRLMEMANVLSIPFPKTHIIRNVEERFEIYEKVDFPVVVKPAYSKIFLGDRWASIGVRYATSTEELDRIILDSSAVGLTSVLIQERIVGEGHGIFALYDRGRPVAFFAHRRLRERPPSGGVSVLSESTALNSLSYEIAQKLLSRVGWHGVAMVEFKLDRNGIPFLMEVNGRFWGSLQLAIDAGVDFPYLLFRLASGETVGAPARYREGCRSRWLLGDLDRLYLILTQRGGRYGWVDKWRALGQFLNPFDGSRHEVNRLADIWPFFFELANYFRAARTNASATRPKAA